MPPDTGADQAVRHTGLARLPAALVFPHAGAGASSDREISKVLNTKFEVIVFRTRPPRPGRRKTPWSRSLRLPREHSANSQRRITIVAGRSSHLVTAWVRWSHSSSSGSRKVWGSTCGNSMSPRRLRRARPPTKPPHPKDDEEILNHLAALEGTDSDVIANRELMRFALPVIKADYNAFDAYACAEDVKVAAPIHAMGGDQDPYITLGDLYGWGTHTDTVKVTMFDGGHFYLKLTSTR